MNIKGLVLAKLQHVFGEYVSGISPENLRVQLLDGIITQENLGLRENALAALKLPVKVHAGRVGKFVVKVPWHRLASQPVEVEIDTIQLVAARDCGLQGQAQVELAQRIKDAIAEKAKQVQTAEIERAGRAAAATNSYFDILSRKIVENLVITITNLHLRFEDTQLTPPLAAGVTLAEIRIVTTDESFQECGAWVEPQEGQDLRFKLLRMRDLEVYWWNPPAEDFVLPKLVEGTDLNHLFRQLGSNQVIRARDKVEMIRLVAAARGYANPLDAPWVAVTSNTGRQCLSFRGVARMMKTGQLHSQDTVGFELDTVASLAAASVTKILDDLARKMVKGAEPVLDEIEDLAVSLVENLVDDHVLSALSTEVWTRRCLISRTSAAVKVTFGVPPSTPVYRVEGEMTNCAIRLGRQQFREMAVLGRIFSELQNKAHHNHDYPRILPGTSFLDDSSCNRWKYAFLLIRMKEFYVNLHTRKIGAAKLSLAPLTSAEAIAIQVLEWRLKLSVIMAFREVAHAEINAIEEKLSYSSANVKSDNSFFSFFGTFGEGMSSSSQEETILLSDEERAELFQAMDSAADLKGSPALPDNFDRAIVEFSVSASSLTIASHGKDLVQATFHGLLEVRQSQSKTSFIIAVQDVFVENVTAAGSGQYRALIDSRARLAVSDAVSSSVDYAARLGVNFTPNGSSNVIDLHASRGLQIVYDPAIFKLVTDVFNTPGISASEWSLSAAAHAAQSVPSVQSSNWNLEADVQAPTFIVPRDCSDDSGPAIAVDFGRLQIAAGFGNGPFPPPKFGKQCHSIQYPDADTEFCNYFNVEMTGAQMVLCKSAVGVDWSCELVKANDRDRMMRECGVKVAIVSTSARHWCCAIDVGSVFLVASPLQCQLLQSICVGIDNSYSRSSFTSSGLADASPTQLSRVHAALSYTTVVNIVSVDCPMVQCLLVDAARSELCTVTMSGFRLAVQCSKRLKLFCALTSCNVTYIPEDIIMVQSIVREDASSGRASSRELVTIKYEECAGTADSGEHRFDLSFAEIRASWHPEIVLLLHTNIDAALAAMKAAHLEPRVGPDLEPEPEPQCGNTYSSWEIKEYRVLHRCVVRRESRMDSQKCGELEVDQIISALNTVTLPSGVVRICCSVGWISQDATDGTILVEPVSKHVPTESQSTVAVYASVVGLTLDLCNGSETKFRFDLRTMEWSHHWTASGCHSTTAELQHLSILQLGRCTRYPTVLGLLEEQAASLICFHFECNGPASVRVPSQGRHMNRKERRRRMVIKLSPMQLVYEHDTVAELIEYFASGAIATIRRRAEEQAIAISADLNQPDDRIEIALHGPRLLCPRSCNSASYVLVTAEHIKIVKIGEYCQLSLDGEGDSADVNIVCVSDFGAVAFPVFDVKLRFLFASAHINAASRKDQMWSFHISVNLSARYWSFRKAHWTNFAYIVGHQPSLDIKVIKSSNGVLFVAVQECERCTPNLEVDDALLFCATQSFGGPPSPTSQIENNCGVDLRFWVTTQPHEECTVGTVRAGAKSHLVAPQLDTATVDQILRGQSKGKLPAVHVCVDGFDSPALIEITHLREIAHVFYRNCEGRIHTLTVIFLVTIIEHEIQIVCDSTLKVTNNTKLALEVLCCSSGRAASSGFCAGHSVIDVPANIADVGELRLRPQALSHEADFGGTPILATEGLVTNQPANFAMPDGSRVYLRVALAAAGSQRLLSIEPAFQVLNLLPEAAAIGVQRNTPNNGAVADERHIVQCGETAEYFSGSVGGLAAIDLDLHLQTGGWRRKIFKGIRFDKHDKYADKTIPLRLLHSDRQLELLIYITLKGPYRAVLYSPTWLCNKTGLQLTLKCHERGWENWPSAETTGVGGQGGVVSIDVGDASRLDLSVGMSRSSGLDINKLGEGSLILPSNRENVVYGLHYIVDSGPTVFSLSRIITIRPAFGIINELSHSVLVRCGDGRLTGEMQEIQPGRLFPLHLHVLLNASQPLRTEWCQFGLRGSRGEAWADRISLSDSAQKQFVCQLGIVRTTVNVDCSSEEVARLIVVASPQELASLASTWIGATAASDDTDDTGTRQVEERLSFSLKLSTIRVKFSNMENFNYRHQSGPASQQHLLSGDCLECQCGGFQVQVQFGWTAYDSVIGELRVDTFRMIDLKRKQKCLDIPRHALLLEGVIRPGSAVPNVTCDAMVGDSVVDTDDIFVIRWFALQANLQEHWFGKYTPPTARDIMATLKCDLNRRVETPAATLFASRISFCGFSSGSRRDTLQLRPMHMVGSFHRRTRWAPEMFPNVPTDARIENQRVTIPSFRLQDILGDAASVHERVLGHIWPAVQRQLRENMSKIVTLENVGAWLEQQTEGLAENQLLKEKAAEMAFPPQQLSNGDIVSKHRRRLRRCQSQQQFDRGIWHFLYDWDHNHTGLGLSRRRCMALVLLNRSCRQIRINSHLVEGDKVHTLNDCLQPLQRHLDWAPEHTSVVFAFGNVPILSMLGAPTGELQLNVDTTAVQINLKHEGTAGISLRPKNRFSCSLLEYNIHKWYTRWVVVIAEASVSIATGERLFPAQYPRIDAMQSAGLVTVTFERSGPLGMIMDELGTDGGTYVVGIKPRSQASALPLIQPGMRLVGVGHRDCSRLLYCEVLDLIRAHSQRPLALTFVQDACGAQQEPVLSTAAARQVDEVAREPIGGTLSMQPASPLVSHLQAMGFATSHAHEAVKHAGDISGAVEWALRNQVTCIAPSAPSEAQTAQKVRRGKMSCAGAVGDNSGLHQGSQSLTLVLHNSELDDEAEVDGEDDQDDDSFFSPQTLAR